MFSTEQVKHKYYAKNTIKCYLKKLSLLVMWGLSSLRPPKPHNEADFSKYGPLLKLFRIH